MSARSKADADIPRTRTGQKKSGDDKVALERIKARLVGHPLPDRVRVMGIDYVVVPVEGLEADGKTIDGRAYLEQGIIMIRSDMGATLQLQTLWHEIVHAIGYQGRINNKRLGSEEVVDYLAWALLQVCRDNPVLVEAWT